MHENLGLIRYMGEFQGMTANSVYDPGAIRRQLNMLKDFFEYDWENPKGDEMRLLPHVMSRTAQKEELVAT